MRLRDIQGQDIDEWMHELNQNANLHSRKKAKFKHSMIHSHVAMIFEMNIQPLMIQERLEHGNIQITLGTYRHLYAKVDDRVVEAIYMLFA